jgi:DNA-binding CsgD family transcriptional regulator
MATPALIGRDAELRVLAGLIDQVADGGGAVVVLGDPGVGKTSLLRAAADRGRAAGHQVLAATGIEGEAHLPFAGLHHLLRPVLGDAGQLPATQQQALSTAFGLSDGPPPQPFMIALATLNLLTGAAAGRPVLVLADDVQWLDQPTQDVLTFLARRVSSDPVVVIGAVRRGHDIAFAAAGLPELDLRGLDNAAARDVLASHAADLSHADQELIFRQAAGNPLALVELPLAIRLAAGSGLESGPGLVPLTSRLERTFAARIADLPPLTRDAVLVAAVDNADDLPEILAAASALAGQPVTVAALETAMTAGLLRFDGLRVQFRHPLVRSGVLQSETVTRRYAANAALAEVLVDEPYRRTWHRAQSVSGQDDAVADELETAHLVSLHRGSVTEAIWALERSAQLTTDSATRGRRLLLAAEHAFGLGRADLVDQLLTRAARTSLSSLDQARMAWLREIFNDGVPGDAERVFALCDTALEAIGAGDSSLALNLLLGAALRCWWADTGPAARAKVAEVAHLVEGGADDPRYAAVLGVSDPVLQGQEVAAILDAVVLESVADPAALWMLGMAAHAIQSPVHGADFLGRADTKLRQKGMLGLLVQVLTMQVLDNLELGYWDRAASCAEEAQRLAEETGQPIWDIARRLTLPGMIAALRGDSERAQEMAAEIEQAAGPGRMTNGLCCAQLIRGYGLVSAGRYADAYAALSRLFDPDDPACHVSDRYHGVMFLAEAAVHAGRVTDARMVMTTLEAEALTTPAPTLHRQLSYARAVLADNDEAEALFAEALRADLTRWPWLRARLELAYGQWLRRQRRAAESRPLVRAAQITFDLIGARSWGDQARSELRAAGERIQAQGPSAQNILSAQELQIATLAAEGLSNREIGERLYLSPRTVGSHLYRIFPKLEVTSRAQLAARITSPVVRDPTGR